MASGKLRLEDVLFACDQERGNVMAAAQRLGCSRWGLYQYLRRTPKAQAHFQHWRECLVDVAERALWLCVAEREPWAVALVLKTLGRARGYAERHDPEALAWDEAPRPVIYLPTKDALPAETVSAVQPVDSAPDDDAMLDEVRRLMGHMQRLIGDLEERPDGPTEH